MLSHRVGFRPARKATTKHTRYDDKRATGFTVNRFAFTLIRGLHLHAAIVPPARHTLPAPCIHPIGSLPVHSFE